MAPQVVRLVGCQIAISRHRRACHLLVRFATGLRNLTIHIRNDPGHFRTSTGELTPETHANVDVRAFAVETSGSDKVPTPREKSSTGLLSPRLDLGHCGFRCENRNPLTRDDLRLMLLASVVDPGHVALAIYGSATVEGSYLQRPSLAQDGLILRTNETRAYRHIAQAASWHLSLDKPIRV